MPVTGKRPLVTADGLRITTARQPTANSQRVSLEALRSPRCCEPTHQVGALPGCSHNRQTSLSFGSVVFTRLFTKQFVRRQKKKAEQLKRASLFRPDGDYNVFLNGVQKTDSEAAVPDTARQLNQQITPCSVCPSWSLKKILLRGWRPTKNSHSDIVFVVGLISFLLLLRLAGNAGGE